MEYNNTKNENTQDDDHHYLPSHQTIFLPGFIIINSNNNIINENYQSRNNNNKAKNLNLRSNLQNIVIQKIEIMLNIKMIIKKL